MMTKRLCPAGTVSRVAATCRSRGRRAPHPRSGECSPTLYLVQVSLVTRRIVGSRRLQIATLWVPVLLAAGPGEDRILR